MNKSLINYDDERTLTVLKESIARDASPAEFAYFLEYCRHTGLNPIKKEIWFIKTSRGIQVLTGINGLFEIANSNPQFDGLEVEFQENERHEPIACTCKVWRKDRNHPHTETVYMNEYNQKQGTWLTKPRTMLAKVAKAHALREAFSQELNGIYIEEEMPKEIVEAQTEPIKKYTYKISAIEDVDKKSTIQKMLAERNIETVIVNGEEYLESEQKLEKLKECEVEKLGD